MFAGMQLVELGMPAMRRSAGTRAVTRRIAAWLAAALPVHPRAGGMSAPLRAHAGDVLAALGDPRFDSEHFHLPVGEDLGFVQVAADPSFKIGTGRKHAKQLRQEDGYVVPKREINAVVTPTGEFYIARYPVTVAQFATFVTATGFTIGDSSALRDPSNRPVRRVSWHEALAYCDWLTQVLKSDARIASCPLATLIRTGWRVTLPSEPEWEVAARGGAQGTLFPWGNVADPNLANYHSSGIADTSAVGCFPPNGLGLHDMIGNVWEWTRSAYGMYPCEAVGRERNEPLREFRVLRGGSFDDPPELARCAYRGRIIPVARESDVGFRVVVRQFAAA